MNKLVNWATAFLNENLSLDRFLCPIGMWHPFVDEDGKIFCKYCKKIPSTWDGFMGFDL